MKTITIQRTDGTYSNEKARAFFGWVDSDIESYNCAHDDAEMPETKVGYKKLEKYSTFIDMFGTSPMTFTKAQMIDIVNNHSDTLNKDGWSNFFPYQNKKGEYFVLVVIWDVSEWYLSVLRLEFDLVWDAECGHVVFLPQQATLSPEPSDTFSLESLNALPAQEKAYIEELKKLGYRIYKTEEVTTEY